MDWNHDAAAARFARDILRRHPQIRFEHAVAAAEFAGVQRLPRDVFDRAITELGILRDGIVAPHGATDGHTDGTKDGPAAATNHVPLTPEAARLLGELDKVREQLKETSAMHNALHDIRRVVRAALEDAELDSAGTDSVEAGSDEAESGEAESGEAESGENDGREPPA